MNNRGFTLIELLVVVAIIGVLSSIAVVALNDARLKGRDSVRKMEITQFGRLITASCYIPDTGPGDYDLAEIFEDIETENPQVKEYLKRQPKDPNGTATETKYRYLVNAQGKCVLYANLENSKDSVSIPGITTATVQAGSGVFEATTAGWNGSTKYFQVSS